MRVEVRDEGTDDKRYFVYVVNGSGGSTFTGLRFSSKSKAEKVATAILRAVEDD